MSITEQVQHRPSSNVSTQLHENFTNKFKFAETLCCSRGLPGGFRSCGSFGTQQQEVQDKDAKTGAGGFVLDQFKTTENKRITTGN